MNVIRVTKTHEWLRLETDGLVTMGITDYARRALGDIVFVELPAIGDEIVIDEECVVLESVKSATAVYAPISGEVTAINDEVVANPGIINHDPQGNGWLFQMRPSDVAQLDSLMDAKAYEAYLAESTD